MQAVVMVLRIVGLPLLVAFGAFGVYASAGFASVLAFVFGNLLILKVHAAYRPGFMITEGVGYMKRLRIMLNRTHADLTLVILLTLSCMLFVLIPHLNETPVRVLLGLLLVLFLPGYSLIAALFPRRDDLDGIERIALSFGLSIAVVPLLGLALNYTPFGIRLVPILVVLSAFTVSLAVVACVRRRGLPEGDRFVVDLAA